MMRLQEKMDYLILQNPKTSKAEGDQQENNSFQEKNKLIIKNRFYIKI